KAVGKCITESAVAFTTTNTILLTEPLNFDSDIAHSCLHHIREGFFHTSKVECTTDKQQECDESRHQDNWTRCRVCTQQRPPEAFDNTCHGVQSVQCSQEIVFDQAAWIGNWRRKHPELGQKRDDIANVTKLNV